MEQYERIIKAIQHGESVAYSDIEQAVIGEGVTLQRFIRDLADRETAPRSILAGDPCPHCDAGTAKIRGTDPTGRELGFVVRFYFCSQCREFLGSKRVSASKVPARKRRLR